MRKGQLGIPFAVFPAFMMYNVELFDEAGIPYPPSAYGEPCVDWEGAEHEWNTDTLAEVAKILSVDINGADATMEEYDTGNIVQRIVRGGLDRWRRLAAAIVVGNGAGGDAGHLLQPGAERRWPAAILHRALRAQRR